MDKLLNLIGLAQKAGRLAVGEEPTGAAARARDARLILVAADAAEKAVALVRDKARAEAMRKAQRNTIAPDAADKIAERIMLP